MGEKERCKGCPEHVPCLCVPFDFIGTAKREDRVRRGNLLSTNFVGCGSSRAASWPGRNSVMRQEGCYFIHRDLITALQPQGGEALETSERMPLEKPSASPGSALPIEATVRVFRPFKDSGN